MPGVGLATTGRGNPDEGPDATSCPVPVDTPEAGSVEALRPVIGDWNDADDVDRAGAGPTPEDVVGKAMEGPPATPCGTPVPAKGGTAPGMACPVAVRIPVANGTDSPKEGACDVLCWKAAASPGTPADPGPEVLTAVLAAPPATGREPVGA
jgi:hypothetical protein